MDIYKNKDMLELKLSENGIALKVNKDELILIQYLLEKDFKEQLGEIKDPLSSRLFEKIRDNEFQDAMDSDELIIELNENEKMLVEYLLEKNALKVSGKIKNPLSAQLFEKIRDDKIQDILDSDDSTGLPF